MSCALPQLALVPRSSEEWLNAEEVMQRTGWSRSTFFLRVGELTFRDTGRRLPNGRSIREFLSSSLPQDAEPAAQTALTVVAPSGNALGPLFAGVAVAASERVILADPEAEQQAQKRLDILAPVRDFQADPARYARLTIHGRPVTSLERMIEYVAFNASPRQSPRTIKRWLARLRDGGKAALADRVRADKGASRWFAQHPQARLLAAYIYLGEVDERGNGLGSRQSFTVVHEQLRKQAAVIGVDPAELPSRETVRAFLSREISPAMRTWARDGKRAYRERMSPYLRRMYTDIYANQVWIGDHMIHDREVANDLFDDQPWGAPIRVRLSAMEDFRSRKIVGASWAWEGSSRAIAATMLRGILAFGPPELIYVDNGKDYKKIARGAHRGFRVDPVHLDDIAPIEESGFLARIGAGVVHCIPRHPQSKAIERFFGTLHGRFDSLGSTYTSGTPFTRPEATEEAMMRHRRLIKAGRVQESNYPLASAFILGCLGWIEEYNNTPHTGEGMDGATPDQMFAATLNPNQKPAPDYTALALLLRDYERRTVHECSITLRKGRYTPAAEDRAGWAAMHEMNEREVLVAFDPAEREYAVVCDLDGRPIAWLQQETLLRFAPNDPATQKQIGDSMSTRRGLEKATRASITTIAQAARAAGARTPEEMLYNNLQIAPSTGAVITQRKPRTRPDKTAQAPASATDIAANFLEALK